MKKIIFCLSVAAALFALPAVAQNQTLWPLATGDTIVNAGTSAKVFNVTAGYAGIVIQVNLNKISGTGAGTVQMQVSADGVNYTNSGSAFTITNVTTQAAYFTLAAPLPTYVKILSTGSGTESVQARYYTVLRRYSTTQ